MRGIINIIHFRMSRNLESVDILVENILFMNVFVDGVFSALNKNNKLFSHDDHFRNIT